MIFFALELASATFACLMQLTLPSVYITTAALGWSPFRHNPFYHLRNFVGCLLARCTSILTQLGATTTTGGAEGGSWPLLWNYSASAPRGLGLLHTHRHPEEHFDAWGQFPGSQVMQCTFNMEWEALCITFDST